VLASSSATESFFQRKLYVRVSEVRDTEPTARSAQVSVHPKAPHDPLGNTRAVDRTAERDEHKRNPGFRQLYATQRHERQRATELSISSDKVRVGAARAGRQAPPPHHTKAMAGISTMTDRHLTA
jgi:hypothetical protein